MLRLFFFRSTATLAGTDHLQTTHHFFFFFKFDKHQWREARGKGGRVKAAIQVTEEDVENFKVKFLGIRVAHAQWRQRNLSLRSFLHAHVKPFSAFYTSNQHFRLTFPIILFAKSYSRSRAFVLCFCLSALFALCPLFDFAKLIICNWDVSSKNAFWNNFRSRLACAFRLYQSYTWLILWIRFPVSYKLSFFALKPLNHLYKTIPIQSL